VNEGTGPVVMLSESESNLNPQHELHRYQALLDLTDLMAQHPESLALRPPRGDGASVVQSSSFGLHLADPFRRHSTGQSRPRRRNQLHRSWVLALLGGALLRGSCCGDPAYSHLCPYSHRG